VSILPLLIVCLLVLLAVPPAAAAPSPFRVRGVIAGGLPMYAGGGATGYYWDSYRAQWERVDETWDHEYCRLDYWQGRLDRIAGEGYNALLFMHPHPFPGLVAIPEFPEAATLTPAQLERNRAWFHGLLDLAQARGIKVYLLTWSIFLPGPFARAHRLPYHGKVFEYDGVDTPESRAYYAAAYRAFFREYPEVGLVPTIGENPVPCVEFMKAALTDTVAAMDPQPEILLRDQGIYPHEFDLLTRGLTNWAPFCKVQEEQFFVPEVGTRMALFQNHTGKRAVLISAGTPAWLFFGGWRFIRDLCLSMERRGGDGLFMESGDGGTNWLLGEAFGRYLANPDRPLGEEQRHWEGRVRARYGGTVIPRDFLAAAEASSGIIPAVGAALYYRNNNYKPQVGLPLISYLGMPSISSYRHTGISRPDLEQAFSWGVPRKDRWSRDWITVPEYVADPSHAAAESDIGPLETAADLEQRAQTTMDRLARLRAQQPARLGDEYARICDLMEAAAHLGRHHAARFRAAVAWQEWLVGRRTTADTRAAVLPLLEDSLTHYRRAADLLARLHGGGAPGKVLLATVNMQPPWNKPGMQSFEGSIEGGMPEMLTRMQAEIGLLEGRLNRGERTTPEWREIGTVR